MAFVHGFENDVFISYAHADNEVDALGDAWVQQFQQNLRIALKQRLGRGDDINIYFDARRLQGNHPLDEILDSVRKSAVFVAVGSPSYVNRQWTRDELAAFAAVSDEPGRLFGIERLPLDEGSAFALQASVIGAAWPQAHDLATPILIKNRGNGAKAYPGAAGAKVDRQSVDSSRPKRWPLREAMLPPPAAGIVALVIASDAHIEERGIKNPAWIRGMGWATETGFLGDRDLKSAPALDAAAERAYEEAGITDPRKALDLVELTDATPYQELLVYDRLGLSSPDKWQSDVNGGSFSADGGLPVNLSGGVAAYNPVFCTGLMRIPEAANQIRGKAGAHQKNGAKLALAHAASGFAMQYQTVLVFGAERGE